MSRFVPHNTLLIAVMALASLFAGCKNTPALPDAGGIDAGPAQNSGAFAVATVGGVLKLYLPVPDLNDAGHGWVTVVDVGKAGNGTAGAPAQVGAIDLGTSDFANTAAATPSVVVAASGPYPDVWVIDPSTDQVVHSTAFDPLGRSGFSGVTAFCSGIAIDTPSNQALFSVWNGFMPLDLGTGQLGTTLQAPPSENFAVDVQQQRAYTPYYDCILSQYNGQSPAFCTNYPTDGLNVIDLATGTVYQYSDSSAPDPTMAVGAEPDSAALDARAQVLVVASESGHFQNIIDFSHATFDSTAHTVTAPHAYIQNLGFTGLAPDPSGAYTFLSEEHTANVAVLNMASVLDGGSGYVWGPLPNAPDAGLAWANIGDPHGLTATTLADGTPVGLVVDRSFNWIARVDLKKMSGLPNDGGYIAQSDMASAVTFLDPRSR